ncbi:hypothetical protein B4119_2620 [Parageobacillus caldoxylosilyticus]|uniref:Uncharacterized protein n=1 Tax=Saccharococcus caldoxylosilyticus TaxID=81408 RepID=A0A150LDC1_9BACL|nr:hypothetical protein B4119_2620 [Parageobacillus caldoxylosilyticus]
MRQLLHSLPIFLLRVLLKTFYNIVVRLLTNITWMCFLLLFRE